VLVAVGDCFGAVVGVGDPWWALGQYRRAVAGLVAASADDPVADGDHVGQTETAADGGDRPEHVERDGASCADR